MRDDLPGMDENRKESKSDNKEKSGNKESAIRARNRTVMLTPEMTGMVRARMQIGDTSMEDNGYFGNETPQPQARSEKGEEEVGVDAKSEKEQNKMETRLSMSGKEGVFYTKITPVVGFLVSFDKDPNGEIFELRVGRFVVTSESNINGSYLYLKEETVSPQHAIIRINANGEIQVLDQLSEFGTTIKRRNNNGELVSIELSGEKDNLSHGDLISFGERTFSVSLLVFYGA